MTETPVDRGKALLVHFYRDWAKNDHEKIIGTRLAGLGFDVSRVACDADLAACDRYWHNAYRRRKSAQDCVLCQQACQRQEAKIPGGRLTIGEFLTAEDRREVSLWVADLKMSEWTTATFDGLPIARWATSSIGTHLRELPVRVDDWLHTSIARDVLHATATAARAARRMVAEVRPSLAVVFSGRFSPTRAFMEVCRAAGVPVMCHEVGDRRRADSRLMPGFGIGERGYWDSLAHLARKRALTAEQSAAINEWVAQRFHDPSIPRYATTDASAGSAWPAGSPRILVAPSSSDENREVDGFDWPGFGSQPAMLEWVAACARLEPSAGVVVRAHPNLAISKTWGPSPHGMQQFRDYATRVPPNVHVIQPADKASLYSYLREADLVVSDFSVATVEAATLGVPAVAAGRSRYWETGCFELADNTVRPWSDIVERARARVSPTTIARGRRCLWNMFLEGEFPEDPGSDSLRRLGLGDAIERWALTHEPWWNEALLAGPDAPPLPHEVVNLDDAIEHARRHFAQRRKSQAEVLLASRALGASRRLRSAARALLGR